MFREDEIFTVTIPLSESDEIANNKELKNIILKFIKNSQGGRTRKEINEYIYKQISEETKNKSNKVRSALTYLKKKGLIENISSDTKSVWIAK
jgi:predicted transcriptional regulator